MKTRAGPTSIRSWRKEALSSISRSSIFPPLDMFFDATVGVRELVMVCLGAMHSRLGMSPVRV